MSVDEIISGRANLRGRCNVGGTLLNQTGLEVFSRWGVLQVQLSSVPADRALLNCASMSCYMACVVCISDEHFSDIQYANVFIARAMAYLAVWASHSIWYAMARIL